MDIRIGSYVAASFLLEREPKQWHVLVMLDSGKQPTDFVQVQALSHCYLRFDDIEEPDPNKQPPTRTQIEEALEFATGKDKLLVSCRAGQGRSVALAYLIGCREHGVAEALKLLDATRHRPNRLVVALGDSLLQLPNVLVQLDAWRQRHAHIRLSDHYHQMELELDALEAQGASNRICDP